MDTSESIKFDLLMNYANEFLVVFPALPGCVQNPRFVYEPACQRAVLYKDGSTPSAAFFPLPEEAAEPLSRASKILCVESNEKAIVSEYDARVEVK